MFQSAFATERGGKLHNLLLAQRIGLGGVGFDGASLKRKENGHTHCMLRLDLFACASF